MYASFFLCGPELRDHHQKNVEVWMHSTAMYRNKLHTLLPEIFGFLFQP